MRIELALGGRPDDAGENLLTVGAGPGTISAADLARHDCGPDRVFGAPVRRVDCRIKQEGPDGREFPLEMLGERWTSATRLGCRSRFRRQAATGSCTKSLQWETQRTWFSSARAIVCPPAKVNGVRPSNDAWPRAAL